MLAVKQRDLTINKFFTKVKILCCEISDLDPTARIVESRMRRIIIHGLRPEYRSFVVVLQGWPTQPSLVDFENLLTNQETLAKQMAGASQKGEEEALLSSKSKDKPKENTGRGSRRNDDKSSGHRGGSQLGGAQKNGDKCNQSRQRKKFDGNCYNCGKKGHIAKNC